MPNSRVWPARARDSGLALAVAVSLGLSAAALHRTSLASSHVPVLGGGVPQQSQRSTPGASSSSSTAAATASPGAGRADPARVKALFLGDGLMVGDPGVGRSTMSELTAGALGWETTVDAQPGSGFTTRGAQSYLSRVTAAVTGADRYDVVLVEGGANDVDAAPDPDLLAARVTEVVAAVRANQPQAVVVLMGVYSPLGSPVSPESRAVDDVISERASTLGVQDISPIADGWVAGRPPSMTGDDRYHPSAEGQRYLADRLTGALRTLSPGPAQP